MKVFKDIFMKRSYNYVKLSSKWTSFGYYGSIVIYSLMSPLILFIACDNYDRNSIFAVVAWLVLTMFMFAVVKYTTLMHIKDNVIFAKKFFRPEVRFRLNQLEKIKVYDSRRDKYIILTMIKDSASEKFLIMHSKLFYSGESIDAENILTEIINENKPKT